MSGIIGLCVHFCSPPFKGAMDVRPYPLTPYVHRPFERTSIECYVVRPWKTIIFSPDFLGDIK